MFNRPFDDQSQIRIRLESEAKLFIRGKIKNNSIALIWSYILDFENSHNPHDERRNAIQKWRSISSIEITETPELLSHANKLSRFNIQPKDTLHAASAIEGKADYFLTTDDKLLSCANRSNMIKAINPIDYIKVLER